MIATGAYEELARFTAPSFEWATGVPVEVVTDAPDPIRAKLEAPEAEQYVMVDADLVFLRKWQIPEVPLDHFAAQPCVMCERNVQGVLREVRLEADTTKFLNTGLFIASSKHRTVMQRAAALYETGFSALQEETALNVALQEAGTPIVRLDAVQNMMGAHVGDTAVHAVRQRTAAEKLAGLKRVLWFFGAPELRKFLAARGVELTEQPRVIRSVA